MKIPELRKNELMKQWIKRRRAKPNTIKNYYGAMALYTEHHNMTPVELKAEAENDIIKRPSYHEIVKEVMADTPKKDTIKVLCANMDHKSALKAVKTVKAVYDAAEIVTKLTSNPKFGVQWEDCKRHYKSDYVRSGPNIEKIVAISGRRGESAYYFIAALRELWQCGWKPENEN